MTRLQAIRVAASVMLVCWLAGCGNNVTTAPDDNTPSGAQDPAPINPVRPVGPTAQSVGDVTVEVAQRGIEPGSPFPSAGQLSARVLNDSDFQVDMTLRFISGERIVHLAFLQVMPGSVTTVISPEAADELRISGVDERSLALQSATFRAGQDFDETNPAVYRVSLAAADGGDDEPTQPIPGDEPGDQPGDEPGDEPAQPDNPTEPDSPPTIELLEPAADVSLPLGSPLLIRWSDASSQAETRLVLGLEPVSGGDFVQLAPTIGVALDGINDAFTAVLQDVEPGFYRIVARVEDGAGSASATAPGTVEVLANEGNLPPTLSLTAPAAPLSLHNGEWMTISWVDHDEDSNATVTFTLVNADLADGGATYQVSPALAEDPDGALADTFGAFVEGILPGTYDLVGTIDDGELQGIVRSEDILTVLPDAQNFVPQISLIAPFANVTVDRGGLLRVMWDDSDENDNAMISLMLDPDIEGDLDGDEVLLVVAIAEDADGAGDEIQLGVPLEMAGGEYRVAARITDGLSATVAFAPGTVTVIPDPDQSAQPVLIVEEPLGLVSIRWGDPISVRLSGENIDRTRRPRFFLSNKAGTLDGDVVAELIPEDPSGAFSAYEQTVDLDTGTAYIPNHAWPRYFRLLVELPQGNVVLREQAEGLVRIRQEVEIVEASFLNVQCPSTVDDPSKLDPPTLSLTWYGGGFDQGSTLRSPVAFWLTSDGDLPGNELGQSHFMFFTTTESPNFIRTDVVEFDEGWEHLADGFYHLLSVVEDPEFGQIIMPPPLSEEQPAFQPDALPPLEFCQPQP